jgi:hypothetical protein
MSLASLRAGADTHTVQAFDQRSRAPADSYRPRRIGRLIVKEPGGSATIAAEVIDVSIRGCELRVFAPIDTDRLARLGLEVRDTTLWVPVRTRSVRRDTHGWRVGCAFERPNADQQRSIYSLMSECNGGRRR